MTTYVLPERYAMAAAHGYRPGQDVRIGAHVLRGVRFGDSDEVVVIGMMSDEVRQQLNVVRATSAGVPKMTYIRGERPERYVPPKADRELIASYLRRPKVVFW